ncbi:MAG: hypothetical protein HY735_32885 [Verrucomicrobia bacterium]|nr:hypothetical protein [Verrucomicrobiota bacterium]
MRRWVLKVERQHRVRLPAPIIEAVPWLANASGSITVTAVLGEHGGIRVLPPGSDEQLSTESITQQLRRHASTADESGKATVVPVARYLANAVGLTFAREQNRASVVMPRELRDLGVAPASGQHAVVFVYGSRLEIWRADEWRSHVRAADGKILDLIEDSADELDSNRE